MYGYLCGHVIHIYPRPILSIGKTMIERETDVEVVSKATTNQRIGRTNVQSFCGVLSGWSIHLFNIGSNVMAIFLLSVCVCVFACVQCILGHYHHPWFISQIMKSKLRDWRLSDAGRLTQDECGNRSQANTQQLTSFEMSRDIHSMILMYEDSAVVHIILVLRWIKHLRFVSLRLRWPNTSGFKTSRSTWTC